MIVGEPRGAREEEGEDRHRRRESIDETGYLIPEASRSHRRRQSEYRRGRFSVDETNLEGRGPRASADSLLRVGSVKKQPTYPLADRRPIDRDSIVRHADTMKDDYGDDGYGYTNPKDMAEYDLGLDGSRGDRPHRRRESWDAGKHGRPSSISGYDDIRRSDRRGDRERGPPPSTRGFDRLPDRTSIYGAPAMHMPMPHEHIIPAALAQEPMYPSDIPQRRGSTRRPVSVYQEPERRVRSDEYEMRDGEPWNNAPRRQETFDDAIETRGFGIRTDLLSGQPPVTITTSPPSARPYRDDRDDRYDRKERDDKRYHERERHDRDRDERRDDRRDDRHERPERRLEIEDRERDRHERPERRLEIEDRERDRPSISSATGIAAGAGGLAAAALGIGAAPPAREEHKSRDDDRDRAHDRDDRDRERERRRHERDDEDEYYRRREHKTDSPPPVDLKGRDPIERRSPVDTRDAETIQRELEQNRSRRESPLQAQDEKVDLTDRYPVIERNVAQDEVHYPDPLERERDQDRRRREDDYSPRTSPRQDSYASKDSPNDPRRGASRREKIYHEDDRATASSPTTFNARDTQDLRAIREAIAMNAEETTPPPRPPKEPLEEPVKDPKRLSRESTDRTHDSRTSDPRSSDIRSSGTLDHTTESPRKERFNFRDTRDIAALRAEISNSSTAATSGSSFESSSLTPRGRDRDRDRDRDSSASPPPHSRSGSHERTSRAGTSSTLRVVSPPRASSAAPPQPVKGILKAPKTWPEDPNPEREGVSLRLDETGKKNWDGREVEGVPKEATWTKISRKLVNPEALERGKERYEEREGSVIVLRVLTKAEVEGYAQLTRDIRAKREEDEERRARRHRDVDPKPHSRHPRDEDEERRERRRRGDETPEEREERRRRRRERHERRRREEPDRDREEREERRRRRKEREREERERLRERERVKAEESSSEDSSEEERERKERRRRREERERDRDRDRD